MWCRPSGPDPASSYFRHMRPDSLLRLRCYINHLLTYLLMAADGMPEICADQGVQVIDAVQSFKH